MSEPKPNPKLPNVPAIPEYIKQYEDAFKAAHMVREALGKGQAPAGTMEPTQAAPKPTPELDAKIKEIQQQLPSAQTHKEVQEELNARRTVWDSLKGEGWPTMTLIDDQQVALGRILEKRKRADSEESRSALLTGLLESAADKVEYTPNNFLFDQKKVGKLDDDAATALQTWAMQHLSKKYASPQAMYENLGDDMREQTRLREEAFKLLAEKNTRGAPRETLVGVFLGPDGPKVVGKAPRFDDDLNKQVAKVSNNALERFLYAFDLPLDVMELVQEGASTDLSKQQISEALGDPDDAQDHAQNVFYSTRNRKPGEVYVPFNQDRYGRYYMDTSFFERSIRTSLYLKLKREAGYINTVPPAKVVRELREKAKAEAQNIITPLRTRKTLMAHKDPYGAFDDYLKGIGWRANTVKALQMAANVGTLGADEKLFGGRLNDYIRLAGALTLPRSTAGVFISDDVERGIVKEGEFFAPLLGEYAPITALDALLRLNALEPIAAVFTLATDDYAKTNGSFEGRPAGVTKNFVNLMDSDRALRRVVVGDKLGARFMNELGDVYINPMLGDFGKEHPSLGRAAGMLAGLAAYVVSPDALLGIGVLPSAARPGVRAAKEALGLEFRRLTGRGAPRINAAIAKATKEVGNVNELDDDGLLAFYEVLRKEINADKTGATHAYDYLAQFAATSTGSVNVALTEGQGVAQTVRFYQDLAEAARKQIVTAQKRMDKISPALGKQTQQQQKLQALQDMLDGARKQADAFEIVLREQNVLLKKGTADLNGMRNTLGRMKLTDDAPLTSAQLFDALRVKAGITDISTFALKHADNTGKIAGRSAKVLSMKRLSTLIDDSIGEASPLAAALRAKATDLAGVVKSRNLVQKELAGLRSIAIAAINKAVVGVRGVGKKSKIKKGGEATAMARLESQVQNLLIEVDKKILGMQKKYDKSATDKIIGEKLASGSMGREVFINYVNKLHELAEGSTDLLRMPRKQYDTLFSHVGTKMSPDILRDPEVVKAMRITAGDIPSIAALSDEAFVETAMSARGLVNLFREPNGYVAMTLSKQMHIWSSPIAWSVRAAIDFDNLVKTFPLFTTNVRYLDIPIRRDVDDASKGIARVTQDVLDTINLAVNNVRGLDEKQQAVELILTSVSRLDDLEYRYNIPLTPKAKITLTALAGFDRSLASTMVEGLVNESVMRAATKGAKAQYMPDDALAPAITSFIRDDWMAGNAGANFWTEIYPLIQSTVQGILRKNANTLLQADGQTALKSLKDAIFTGLTKAKVPTDTSAFAQVSFSQAVVLGAVQHRWAKKYYHIVGPRFNESIGRSMNRFQGRGTQAGSADYIPVKPTVGSYVLLRHEINAWNALVKKAGKTSRSGIAGPDDVVRSVLVEDRLSPVLGNASRRINKIEDDMVYFNTDEAPVKISEVFMRDPRVSLLDALDGFSGLGMRMMTTSGRDQLTRTFGVVRDTYQRMVLHSVDAQGNVLMMPRGAMPRFHASLDQLAKEFSEQMSEVMLTPAVARMASWTWAKFHGFISFFKRHVLYGLTNPRVAYFTNMHVGEYAQMADAIGPLEAIPLSMHGSLGSFPVFGKSLQNQYYARSRLLPPGKIGLPSPTAATFNSSLDRIFQMSDETLYVGKNGEKITGIKFYAEAMEDGVGEFLRGPDFSSLISAEAKRQIRNNPDVFFKVYDSVSGYQRILELKIREVTRRQRMLLYAHLRINKGMSRETARKALLNSMYDWSFSVGRVERALFGDLAFFYTLVKNGFAQQYRMLFEASQDKSLQAYLAKYAQGQTKLQRMEMISRFQMPYAGYADPYTDRTPKEQRDLVAERNLTHFFADYPILTTGTLPPEAYRQMLETAGFAKQNWAIGMAKPTTVEFAVSTANIASYLTAIIAAGILPEDSPYAADAGKATGLLFDELVDTIANPIYGEMAKAVSRDARTPKSPYGRVVRPGDLQMVENLKAMGLDFLVETVPDSKDPRIKRIKISGPPILNELLFGILRTERNRFATTRAMFFPDLSDPEIKALAENDKTRMMLYNAGNTFNVGRVIFYNGEDNRINDMKTAIETVRLRDKTLQRQALAPLKKE